MRLKENRVKKASISVYLCLALCVILSLIYACIDSVRYSSGRAALSCAMDEAMFSLFSNYEKTLFDDYGLMFFDAGYGTGELQMGTAVKEVADEVEKIISPEVGAFFSDPKSLYRIGLGDGAVLEYCLATDSDFQKIREQICDLESIKMGVDMVNGLGERLSLSAESFEKYGFSSETELKDLLEDYQNNTEELEELRKKAEAEKPDTSQKDKVKKEEVEIPEDFVNPLDNANEIMSIGFYDYILPKGKSVSGKTIDTTALVSRRSLNTGMGVLPVESHPAGENIMLGEYALGFFSNFMSKDTGTEFKYQTEYVIAGKTRDGDNLKSVLTRLLLIREGLNYCSLWMDAAKQAEIEEISMIIAAVTLSPQLEPMVQQLLMLLYSHCESYMDLKALLEGKKIPVFKDSSSWQLSWDLFGLFSEETKTENCLLGLGYEDYLRVLLYMLPEKELTARTMDMIEYNKRQKDDNEAFRLDNCISSVCMEFDAVLGSREVTVNRSYGYEKE